MKIQSQTISLNEWGDRLTINLPLSRSIKISLNEGIFANDDVTIVYDNAHDEIEYKAAKRLERKKK